MRLFKSSFIIILFSFFLQLLPHSLHADEGMWLISMINKNIEEMQRLGLTLSAEDIYSINHSSLKDAVVQLDDGGCTAEIISSSGLILTNHHCAVSDIQYHSTPENNLLLNGYWASSYDEELPVPGKSALILKRVEDVTKRVIKDINHIDDEYFNLVSKKIEHIANEVEKTEKGTHAMVVPMYNHNQYILFVYYRFTDVRLVGAPPSSIGNFGGDLDNWRWPRHTGDFTLFRIYTAPNGMPADYSKRNKPYMPKHHFPVSLEGVKENDFTMVIGYPGTTHRFSSSSNAAHERDVVAPWMDSVWGDFIESLKIAMREDIEKKVHYTDRHETLINFFQKDIYQAQSMFRFNVVERLKAREDELVAWVNQTPTQRNQYLEAIKANEEYFNYINLYNYEQLFRSLSALVSWPIEIGDKIYEVHDLFIALVNKKKSNRKVKREARKLTKQLPDIYKNYFPDVDMQLYSTALTSLIKYLQPDVDDPFLIKIKEQENQELFIPLIVNHFYNESYFTSSEKFERFLKDPNIDSLSYDPLFMLQLSYEELITAVQDSIAPYRNKHRLAMKTFTKGILELEKDKLHYPDANSTMRLSYGKVIGYKPRDGVTYRPVSYLEGKIEKENPDVDVFFVEPRIKDLWETKDFGPYADEKGLPLCFTTDNDITGGNSGSPVINAQGHLVGVAFDGNYEAMACDFIFEPHMQRTIVTDIRYVLFIIDKYAGAKRLIDEMTIITQQ